MKKLITQVLLAYIRFFAKLALWRNPIKIIGITGSAGKTSTRDALYAILKDHHKTYVITKGNSETGIPLGILGLKVHSLGFDSIHKSLGDWLRLVLAAPTRIQYLKGYEYLIVEMGVDDPYPPKNMGYLLSIVKPQTAVILNAYETHGEAFEKVIKPPVTSEKIVEAIATEKCRMATDNDACVNIVYNADCEAICSILQPLQKEQATFGKDPTNRVSYGEYRVSPHATTCSFLVDGSKLTLTLKGYVLPIVYQETFAAAIATASQLGLQPADIKAALEMNFSVEPGRSTLLAGIEDSLIIDSSYNASPESMKTLISLAFELKQQTKRPLVCVLGDMRELGTSARRKHEDLAEIISHKADYIYTVGPLMEKHVSSKLQNNRKHKDVQAFSSPHDVGKYLKKHPVKNAIYLFKGSQNTIFLEEAIKYILADQEDSARLARQEDYWLRKKQFLVTKDIHLG